MNPTLIFTATNTDTRRAHIGNFDAVIIAASTGTPGRGRRNYRLNITTYGRPLVSSTFATLKGARDYAQATADVMPAELFAVNA